MSCPLSIGTFFIIKYNNTICMLTFNIIILQYYTMLIESGHIANCSTYLLKYL